MSVTDVSEGKSTAFRLHLLGTFVLEVNGQPAPNVSRAGRSLVALLALRSPRPLERDFLATTLWPDSDDASARYNLRRTLTELRSALGVEAERLQSPSPLALALDFSGSAFCDVVDVDAALASKDEERLADVFNRFPTNQLAFLLPGDRLEWLASERAVRAESLLAGRERLAQRLAERAEWQRAAEHLQAVIAADPLHEKALRSLMQALSKTGRTTGALAQYQRLKARLRAESNVRPDAETTALYEELLRGSQNRGSTSEGSTATITVRSDQNLPRPLSALIGRERDRLEVGALLTPEKDRVQNRLVTLVGSGGIGKTRLAVAVAEALLPDYKDGACFIDLAPLIDPHAIIPLIARAIGISDSTDRAPDALLNRVVEKLRPQQTLIVLDNAEHLIEESARVSLKLLEMCPNLAVLATSREALHVLGETTWRVPELSPEASIHLFAQRAEQADFSFRLAESNLPAVREIVIRLDGIPLAIEMAAARVRVLSVAQISDKLDDVFRLLGGVPRGGSLPRRRTLRATLDWSYDLLSSAEQTMLTRLSVFAGGWTLEAAEAVGAADGVAQRDVFDLLASLIDKSLAQFDIGEDALGRYRMLETVRQYAAEKLQQSGETARTYRRHLTYFRLLAEKIEPLLTGSEKARWLDVLEVDFDNIRAALRSAEDAGDDDKYDAANDRLSLATALGGFWSSRIHASEGRACLAAALEQAMTSASTLARARGLGTAGGLAYLQSDFAVAQDLCEKALALWPADGNKGELAVIVSLLGANALEQGDRSKAKAFYEESLALRRSAGDPAGITSGLLNLSNIARHEGQLDEARLLCEEGLSEARRLKNDHLATASLNHLATIAFLNHDAVYSRAAAEEALTLARRVQNAGMELWSLINLGLALRLGGDYAAAVANIEASLSLSQKMKSGKYSAHALDNLAETWARMGNIAKAWTLLDESVTISRDSGYRNGMAWSMYYKYEIYLAQGDIDRAALLYGTFEVLSAEVGNLLLVLTNPTALEGDKGLRALLGESEFEAARLRGRALTLEEMIALPQSVG